MSGTKIIYCGNCGKKGHIYKNCHKPIISLGIICIKYDNLDIKEIFKKNRENGKVFNRFELSTILQNKKIKSMIDNNLKFLLVCRKHTLGFIEFIRGNYNLENYEDINYLKEMFNRMTDKEIQLITEKDFDKLWKNVWILEKKNSSHLKEYENSKIKFNNLIEGCTIKKTNNQNINFDLTFILKNTKSKWFEPEWEFPKGRRNIKEEDLDCANREFQEETNFSSEDYELINDSKPLSEIFMGNNFINYKYIYYLAQSLKKDSPLISENNIHQKIEISNISWFSYSEAMKKIRYYNVERKEVLYKIYNLIFFNLYHYFNDLI